MKLEITPTQAKILKMALYSEKDVQYNDTKENHLKHHKEINSLIDKIRFEEQKIQNNENI
mgnify:CR=1 FL=1